MNYPFFPKKLIAFFVPALLAANGLSAQTQDQAKSFINRTQTSIFKVQKELVKQSVTNKDAELKKAIQYQLIAVKQYNEGKYGEAVGMSYSSRIISIGLLSNLAKDAVTQLDINDEEKKLGVPPAAKNAAPSLSREELEKTDRLDVKNVRELLNLDLGIKSN